MRFPLQYLHSIFTIYTISVIFTILTSHICFHYTYGTFNYRWNLKRVSGFRALGSSLTWDITWTPSSRRSWNFLYHVLFPHLELSSFLSRCLSASRMTAFSSTSSGTVTSQSQYLSSSSSGPRPRPIFWASSYLESSRFFLLLLLTPTFIKSLEPHFPLLVLRNLHITSSATACLQLCPLRSGFQPSQSCFTPSAVTSDHVPTCNFATPFPFVPVPPVPPEVSFSGWLLPKFLLTPQELPLC